MSAVVTDSNPSFADNPFLKRSAAKRRSRRTFSIGAETKRKGVSKPPMAKSKSVDVREEDTSAGEVELRKKAAAKQQYIKERRRSALLREKRRSEGLIMPTVVSSDSGKKTSVSTKKSPAPKRKRVKVAAKRRVSYDSHASSERTKLKTRVRKHSAGRILGAKKSKVVITSPMSSSKPKPVSLSQMSKESSAGRTRGGAMAKPKKAAKARTVGGQSMHGELAALRTAHAKSFSKMKRPAPMKTIKAPPKKAGRTSATSTLRPASISVSRPTARSVPSRGHSKASGTPTDSGSVLSYFGVAIDKVESLKVVGYCAPIPRPLVALKRRIVEDGGFKRELLFHKLAESDGSQAFVASALIRQWFSDLPTPFLEGHSDVVNMAISVEAIPRAVAKLGERKAAILVWLWDLCADVLEFSAYNRMDSLSLGQSFGPLMTRLSERDLKRSRLSMMAMFASRVITFFQRGIEWRASH